MLAIMPANAVTVHGTAETASIRWRRRDFKILDRLGNGKFGGVSLALDNGTYVALKLITKNHPQERIAAKYVKREVEIQTR
jgi:serine/threonine protein kinase